MATKEFKPDLNALNCVSLYKHEACEAPARATVRRARVPRQKRAGGKPHGLLGLRERVHASRDGQKKPGLWRQFQRRRDISMVDLAVAFGFLIFFSAATTFAMILALD